MLEEGGGAGAVNAGQATVARATAVSGRKGGDAIRVIDVEVVLVPVTAVRLQPSLLYTCISVVVGWRSMAGLGTGMGPMKKRREVR